MSADFFNTIPLDFFMPNKKQGISSLYHLLGEQNIQAC